MGPANSSNPFTLEIIANHLPRESYPGRELALANSQSLDCGDLHTADTILDRERNSVAGFDAPQ